MQRDLIRFANADNFKLLKKKFQFSMQEKFKSRYSITVKRICDESASVSKLLCNEWVNIFRSVLVEY